MRIAWIAVALISLLVGSSATANLEATETDCGSAPPCGWINPQLFLDLPDNIPCGTRGVLGAEVDPSLCMAPPTVGNPVEFTGEFRLTWEVSEEGTYASDPNDPVEVNFRATGSNPSFIDFAVNPSAFTLDSSTLANPAYLVAKERADGSSSIWYEYIQPVTVTLTRNGEPSADDLERIQNKDGQVRVLIRIHSDSSGSTFKDSYGLEAITFHVGAAQEDDLVLQEVANEVANKSTPGPAFAALLVGLVAAVAATRRQS